MENTTALSNAQLQDLVEIARDLTVSLAAEDRYARLLNVIRRLVPCDAACLLRLERNELVPVAAHGLVASALSKRFDRREHPRLDVILNSKEPVRFPMDSRLADPFDGLLDLPNRRPSLHDTIHACLGCALTEGGEVVGALTADALEPRAFDHLDPRLIAMLGALAGAAMRTTALIEALRQRADHQGRVAREVVRNAVQGSGEILGTSAAAVRLRQEIAIVAGSDLAVLITGETGVGKELVSRHVHAMSPRAEEAFIQVSCAALPESIAESELFGHVAGAFTGATRDRAGKFEIADGGTLFLDEIGELPLTVQPKLLRALQQGEIQRIGSDRVHRVNVRVIAATNRDLEKEVEQGRFRADLFHRLAGFPLHVPSLRERRQDIPLLATHFVDNARRRLGTGSVRLTPEAHDLLFAADWPGNVRELENVVTRAVVRAAFGRSATEPITVGIEHFAMVVSPRAEPQTIPSPRKDAPILPLRQQLEEFQRRVIRESLERNGGKWAAVARELGMHRSNLHTLAKRLGLNQ
ncbi:MAG TPA: nitric oxide reductase transcriptional regulator NorR [Verrucomicrobiae bacterium]|nr:nitric oxide reductase transcriptional regulator NorR [Verrucomicrobiae bacterium]